MRKTRLISFRVYEDQYSLFRDHCEREGVKSISELARIALDSLVGTYQEQRSELARQITQLTAAVGRLDGRVVALEAQSLLCRDPDGLAASQAMAPGRERPKPK